MIPCSMAMKSIMIFPGIGRKIILLNARQIFRKNIGSHIILLAMEDITARKQAEEALLKAGALQSAIFNSANFSSIATDAKGVIQIFNVGAERMLGYTAAEVMNKITPADISDPQEVIARAKALSLELDTPITPGFEALVFKASRGIEDIYELTYIRKDGSRFPAVVSVTALRDEQDAIIGYLLIGTDNTARKQVEAERARLDQVLQDKNIELESAKFVAEKANLAKSDFLSSMSHELRTPLGAILGFAQLMESGAPEPTPAQKRSIDQILKAGWYLLELINEILDLALIESGKLSLSLEPVSLAEVMHECEIMVEPQAQQRGISVDFTSFETPYFVNADRTRVKQLLINLLSNAIKYNKADGTVTVTCTLSPPDSIRISVRDTGAGLAPEQLAQLFQPFNRLGQKANVEEGTGIGLVVCKRLVELMGGVIGVESTVGEGSVFWLELNRTAEPQAAAHTAEFDMIAQEHVSRRCTVAHPALRRGQPGQSDAGRGSHCAPARYPLAECTGRHPRHRDCAHLPAGCHPDGHQSARHQRYRCTENPGRRPANSAHPGRCAQCQCNTPRYRERPGGRILPLSHQTDQGQRVHGYAGHDAGVCKNRSTLGS